MINDLAYKSYGILCLLTIYAYLLTVSIYLSVLTTKTYKLE